MPYCLPICFNPGLLIKDYFVIHSTYHKCSSDFFPLACKFSFQCHCHSRCERAFGIRKHQWILHKRLRCLYCMSDQTPTDTLYLGGLDQRVTRRILYDLCIQVTFMAHGSSWDGDDPSGIIILNLKHYCNRWRCPNVTHFQTWTACHMCTGWASGESSYPRGRGGHASRLRLLSIYFCGAHLSQHQPCQHVSDKEGIPVDYVEPTCILE